MNISEFYVVKTNFYFVQVGVCGMIWPQAVVKDKQLCYQRSASDMLINFMPFLHVKKYKHLKSSIIPLCLLRKAGSADLNKYEVLGRVSLELFTSVENGNAAFLPR